MFICLFSVPGIGNARSEIEGFEDQPPVKLLESWEPSGSALYNTGTRGIHCLWSLVTQQYRFNPRQTDDTGVRRESGASVEGQSF